MQTRRLVRQMARMQETLNALNERLESIDRQEMNYRRRVAHDGEGRQEDTDAASAAVDASQDADGSKSFL